MILNLLGLAALLGQAAPDAQVRSVWEFCVKGGPLMIPIGICSLVALAIIAERTVSLRRRNVIPTNFYDGLRQALEHGGASAAAAEYCRRTPGPCGPIFETLLAHAGEPREALEKYAAQTGEREVLKLRKFMRPLAVIVSIAPMLGLLGTIFGMITAFQTVAASGEALGRTEVLAKGIYEALITTAAGLMVAIPTVLAYHWISGRVERLVAEIDGLVADFLDRYAPPASAHEAQGHRLRHNGDQNEPVPVAAAAAI